MVRAVFGKNSQTVRWRTPLGVHSLIWEILDLPLQIMQKLEI